MGLFHSLWQVLLSFLFLIPPPPPLHTPPSPSDSVHNPATCVRTPVSNLCLKCPCKKKFLKKSVSLPPLLSSVWGKRTICLVYDVSPRSLFVKTVLSGSSRAGSNRRGSEEPNTPRAFKKRPGPCANGLDDRRRLKIVVLFEEQLKRLGRGVTLRVKAC